MREMDHSYHVAGGGERRARELTVPTCSYRMGEAAMGAGAAVIGQSIGDGGCVSCMSGHVVLVASTHCVWGGLGHACMGCTSLEPRLFGGGPQRAWVRG